ncbi:MAG: hypothetical protein ABIG52_02700 [Nanoarchaeota archaeon]
MGLREAIDYTPTNLTYAIRIDSQIAPFTNCFALQNSGLYTIVKYVFDDRTPKCGSGKLFDADIAQRLLTDFRENGLDHDTLLVHCFMGRNRSPAVGMALNEIFELGHDTDKLKKQYREANWFVYDTLIEVAKRLI